MRKIYSQPSAEIYDLTQTDVITASGNLPESSEDNFGGLGSLFES